MKPVGSPNRLQVSLQRQPCPMIKYMKSCQTTLNAVKLTFTNYNQESNKYKFSMSAPETVLLLREKDMDSFFVNNELANNVTSFVATHNSIETNQYTFMNIARLVSACINEKGRQTESQRSGRYIVEWNCMGNRMERRRRKSWDTLSNNPRSCDLRYKQHYSFHNWYSAWLEAYVCQAERWRPGTGWNQIANRGYIYFFQ